MNLHNSFSVKTNHGVFYAFGIALALFGSFGCRKFVQVDPPVTSITAANVFADNISAAAAMTSVYAKMITPSGTLSSGSISVGCLDGLASDELKNYSTFSAINAQFYSNTLNSINSDPGWWSEIYNELHVTNAVIEGLASSKGVTRAAKAQLTGEAKFMRGFLNFYATNLYGDVPLVTSTDFQTNNTIKRAPQATVYEQIVQDLKDAQAGLSDNFVDPYGNTTTERVRPNKGAATALLARVYLYLGKWDSAEIQSTNIINNTAYSLDSNLNNVFLANSSEAIWQLQSIVPGVNTYDAIAFVLTSPPGAGSSNVALSTNLLNAFEAGDRRRQSWVGVYTADSITYYYFPYKYKKWIFDATQSPTEYTMALRLSEQYLIRAEARAQKGNIQGSQDDLNVIRTRAGLPNTGAGDAPSLLRAILHERQVELFTEWGHRWFDLIRTANINSVMGPPGNVCQAKGGTWNPDWIVMPIPHSEILINPNLTQNAGYGN